MLTFFRCKAEIEIEVPMREFDKNGVLLDENPEKQNLAARLDMGKQFRKALEETMGKRYGEDTMFDVHVTDCEFIQYDRKSVEKENG